LFVSLRRPLLVVGLQRFPTISKERGFVSSGVGAKDLTNAQ
jgi:hypothetical protein